MKLKKIFCLFIIIALVNYPVSSFFFAVIAGLKDFWEVVTGVIDKATEAANKAAGIHPRFETDLFGDKTEAVLDYLVDKVDEISQDIKDMEKHMEEGFSKLEELITDVEDKVHANTLMDRVIQSADRIKDNFDTIQNYQKRRKPTKKRLEAFIETFIRGKGPKSVESDLKTIFQSVTRGSFSKNEKNLLTLMIQSENKRFYTKCGEKKSAQSTLYQFFFSIANIEMVGLSTLAYGFVLNEAEKSADNITELASDEYPILIDQLTDRLNTYSEQFIQAMRSVSRQFRTCDPPMHQHSRNETFTEMSGLMQEVLYSEYKIQGHDTCSSSCEQVRRIDTSGNQDCWVSPPGSYGADKTRILPGGIPESDYYCTTPRTCMGEISHCFTVWSVRYCFSDQPYKRYDWVTSRDHKDKYGVVDNCEGRLLNDWEWQRYWAYDCGYCMCLCYDDAPESKSVHTVSLKPARSDTKNNKLLLLFLIIMHVLFDLND
ncbi:hypothetical protein HCN44_004586 [Aphidius gifuensis]|uniref:Uncharacterized protein n=1 Tax=Aphidius gifuensis TaxID=684658 RepID=A0A835CSL2_APHGI|nr:hypothetical protein HCN44_004586 [Aphidius gifuensis]